MAHVYITDEARIKLDVLVEKENRTPSLEIDFLCTKRMEQLNIPADTTPSSEAKNTTSSDDESQEQSTQVNEVA